MPRARSRDGSAMSRCKIDSLAFAAYLFVK
jgi:hypothetical protein